MLRYLLAGVTQQWFNDAAPGWASFPVGTILINVTGCFAVGLLASLFAGPLAVRDEMRLAVVVGLLGGYTTFSAFGRETFQMLQDGRWAWAGLNVLISNIAGLLAVFLGHLLATRIAGSGASS